MKVKTHCKVLLIAAAVVIVLVSAAAYVTLNKTRAMMDFRDNVLMYTPWRHVILRTTYEFKIPWWTPRGLSVKNRPLSEVSHEDIWQITATFYDLENEERLYKNLDWLLSRMGVMMDGIHAIQVKAAVEMYLNHPDAIEDTIFSWFHRYIRVSRAEGNIVVAVSWYFTLITLVDPERGG